MTLAATLALLERGERVSALDELIAAWRVQRSPAIADAIDALSADVERCVAPWPWSSATLSGRHDRWLDICAGKQASEVPRLLERVADRQDRATLVALRLAQLERHHGHDPRVARALVGLVCGGYPWGAQPLWTTVFRMLAALRDVRGRAPLLAHWEQVVARSTATAAKFGARIDKLARALAAVSPPPLSADDTATLAAIVERARTYAAGPRAEIVVAAPPPIAPAPQDRDEAALLAQIYAAVDDPGPRQVYGDWCAQQAATAYAARGELIGLQYKPNPTKPDAARVRALIKQHAADWLAGIDRVIEPRSIVFAGGFLAACTTRFKNKQQRQSYATDPRWQTLVSVDTDEATLVRTAGALRELRCNERFAKDLALAGKPVGIASLCLYGYGWSVVDPGKRGVLDLLGATDAFPALREFVGKTQWTSAAPAQFPTTGAFAHLATLRLEQPREVHVPVAAWLRRARAQPSLARIEIVALEHAVAFVDGQIELDLAAFSGGESLYDQLARSFADVTGVRVIIRNAAPTVHARVAALLPC